MEPGRSPRFGSGHKPVLSTYVAGLLTKSLDMKRTRRDIYVRDINSNDSSLQLEATKKLALLLEADPRLGDLRPQDIRVLIGFLNHQQNPQLQFYALFVLTNVDDIGGDLIRHESLSFLMQLMKSDHMHTHTQMQVLITLSRISYDFPLSINYLCANGTFKALENTVMTYQYNDMMLLNCSTFLAILCRGILYHYHPTRRERATILRIVRFLWERGDWCDDLRSHTTVAVSYFVRKGSHKFNNKASVIYVAPISDADPLIVTSVLQVVGNIFASRGAHRHMMWMLENGLLHRLYTLSHRKYKMVRFQVCRILSLIDRDCKEKIWRANGVFEIVENEKLPKVFSVIKDLVTGQQIDFAEPKDNFLQNFDGYYLVSIGPFSSEIHSNEGSFSKLRWVAEFYTQKHFLY